jgi:hypothetical protein
MCKLLATWTIAHLDKNGVFYGDAAMVKASVLPLEDLTLEQVEAYLGAIEASGLIVRFEARGRKWQYWPGFENNQIALRKDREHTDFPDPPSAAENAANERAPGEQSPDNRGTTAGSLPDNLRKVSGNDPASCRKASRELPPQINVIETNSGVIEDHCDLDLDLSTNTVILSDSM